MTEGQPIEAQDRAISPCELLGPEEKRFLQLYSDGRTERNIIQFTGLEPGVVRTITASIARIGIDDPDVVVDKKDESMIILALVQDGNLTGYLRPPKVYGKTRPLDAEEELALDCLTKNMTIEESAQAMGIGKDSVIKLRTKIYSKLGLYKETGPFIATARWAGLERQKVTDQKKTEAETESKEANEKKASDQKPKSDTEDDKSVEECVHRWIVAFEDGVEISKCKLCGAEKVHQKPDLKGQFKSEC